MDSLTTKELDKIYQRVEEVINVNDQTQIEDFIRTHRVFDGKDDKGKTKFKLMKLPLRGGQKDLVKSLYAPSRIKDEIKKSERLDDIERVKGEIDDSVPKKDELRRLVGVKISFIRTRIKDEIKKSERLDDIERVKREIDDSVPKKDELRRLVGVKISFIKRTEAFRTILNSKDSLPTRYKRVNSLARDVYLSEEEVRKRLEEIGVGVEDGKIIR